MGDLTPFVIAGLVTGSVYGLAAVGLVLTYKTSGIFNFAHGALATVGAFAFYSLHISAGLPWVPSALIVVLLVGPVLGVVFELLARSVAAVALELRIAATVGVLLFIQAIVTLAYGTETVRTVPVFLPSGTVTIAGTVVKWSDIDTFVIAVAVTLVLSLGLQLTRLGAATRAVVEDPDLLDLAGISPVVTRRLAWCAGAALATLSGVLFATLLPLDPVTLTLLVVQAFGAAAVGRFTSLPWTFVGGLVVGVASSVATKYFTTGLLAGLPAATPFVLLFVVLLVLPKRALVERSRAVVRIRSDWRLPAPINVALCVALVVVLAFAPSYAGIHLTDWTVMVGMIVVFLSLGLLVRTSGQVSLAHMTFTAIGAAAFSHLSVGHGWPWGLALIAAGLVAVPIGAVLAIPAIRLSGLFLALATFGFGVVVQVMFYTQGYMFGDDGLGLAMPRPSASWLSSDAGYYRLALAVAGVVTLIVIALDRGRLGRLLRGLADSPTAMATNGVATDVTRVLVFCVSAFFAAVGGALVGVAQSTVSADSYQPLTSLMWFAVIVIVVGHEPWYAIMAAAATTLVPSYVVGPHVTSQMQLVFGALAVATAALARRRNVPLGVRAFLDRMGRRPARPSAAPATAPMDHPRPSGALEVSDLQVRFGGVMAVNGFRLKAPAGAITGLIGPNGAGKTTTFNACTGLVRPTSGAVALGGRPVTHTNVWRRARQGLGRTFQRIELLDSLSVRANVSLGAEGLRIGGNPARHLVSMPGDRAAIAAATNEALRLCGIEDIADRVAGSLSTGQRRLVELARALAGDHTVILLDEPGSGLDHTESRQMGEILRSVVDQRGVGVLLVEHDMSLVLDICDHIYVLDFGKPVFDGTPDQIRSSPEVQAAYLGSTAEDGQEASA